MSKLREAAQQALEVCEDVISRWDSLAPLSVRSIALKSLQDLRDALYEEHFGDAAKRTSEFWTVKEGWVSIPDDTLGALVGYVYPEFFEGIKKSGCWTVYAKWKKALDTEDMPSIPLYADPNLRVFEQPRREWIGLTDEEIADAMIYSGANHTSFSAAIEAKLKEKNT